MYAPATAGAELHVRSVHAGRAPAAHLELRPSGELPRRCAEQAKRRATLAAPRPVGELSPRGEVFVVHAQVIKAVLLPEAAEQRSLALYHRCGTFSGVKVRDWVGSVRGVLKRLF